MPNNVDIRFFQDGQIVYFRLNDSSRKTIDFFCDYLEQLRYYWIPSKPFVAMLDVSSRDVYLSTYARRRLKDFARTTPESFYGTYSVIISKTSLGTFTKLFFDEYAKVSPQFEIAIFEDYKQSLAWTYQKLANLQRRNSNSRAS